MGCLIRVDPDEMTSTASVLQATASELTDIGGGVQSQCGSCCLPAGVEAQVLAQASAVESSLGLVAGDLGAQATDIANRGLLAADDSLATAASAASGSGVGDEWNGTDTWMAPMAQSGEPGSAASFGGTELWTATMAQSGEQGSAASFGGTELWTATMAQSAGASISMPEPIFPDGLAAMDGLVSLGPGGFSGVGGGTPALGLGGFDLTRGPSLTLENMQRLAQGKPQISAAEHAAQGPNVTHLVTGMP